MAERERVGVDVTNFVRAESDTYFDSLLTGAGLGSWEHRRAPTPVDDQVVVRMNRDTLYSSTIVDISAGAELSMPDTGGRYQTAMIVDQDHYIEQVCETPGLHALPAERFKTQWVAIAVRTLVDPTDPDDLAQVVKLQDQLRVAANASAPFTHPRWDADSLASTRKLLQQLAAGLTSFRGAFGARDRVDPVRHLLGTAAGWGGLPDDQALYLGVEPHLPVGHYALSVGAVPVRGFWSVSVYNRDGFFEINPENRYSVNSLTAEPNDDGTVTINFGGPASVPNHIPVTEGWNYTVRLYQPEPELLDGSWTFPSITT